ncbi:MAG: HAMP domain-containing histidine kinase [Sulfuricellaceae bacterium]|nr:HAMP domain-containing histidine kinase [Sulfuricellaceae bacterium]
MFRFQTSVAVRLVLGYGLLATASIAVASAIFYLGTIGVLDQNVDDKIVSISKRLIDKFQARPVEDLCREIKLQLSDKIDSDREIFLVLSPSGHRLTGNLSTWPSPATPLDRVVTRDVVREGKAVSARLLMHRLQNAELLIVGRDLSEHITIGRLVWRALAVGITISLLLTVVGALFFRHQIEARIGDIRRTAVEIEAGDLTRRIPISSDDEFGLLSREINHMLDRIEHLMESTRHVSNAIAHDLRTPLGRIRSKLDDAVRHDMTVEILSDAAHDAIEGIDDLILVFEKLLQIAEAESGMRTKLFETVDLNRIALDMVDLYDATAEERQVILKTSLKDAVFAHGDRNLLASAVASLIDNAIKYAGPGATVEVGTLADDHSVSLVVRDNGPGIPQEYLPKVTERFYRLDQSRSQPGNGLGLSIVSAIATLHVGKLILENDTHGLIARIILPPAEASAHSR